ncbi:MFS transporter [Rhodococcus wratislaviensis]|uniref:Putative major facilitator superfamily transporter n=1 Tax=Rhodococcus wratislaviensis NBRC 100605 TaxID=1219028 RepID=X0PYX4_RHOWR|nr:MFS transporter [Rhodococcus wratislaviensis]GAF43642.1 putative major facilitator superfamily transporter [Rhodococcus wratislaviensis NBRC 100605]
MTYLAAPDPGPTAAGTKDSRLDSRARKAASAGFVGTFIEYYDFGLYGLLTVYFAPLFFPAASTSTSLLAGLAVFGAGFVARPVGGLIFGRIGDRVGRRPALIASLIVMGLCSGTVGLLPTYDAVGLWAPVLLVVLRLGQGLSAGSEMLGSVTFVLESAPPRSRIFLASLTPFGAALGTTVATASVWILSSTVDADWMRQTGWRVLFLAALPLLVVAVRLRSRLEDSPEFDKMVENNQVASTPIRTLFRNHWHTILLAGGVAIAANGTAGLLAWFSTYLVGSRGLQGSSIFAALALASAIGAASVPLSGWLTARFGQRRVASIILAAFIVSAFPVLWLLGTGETFIPLVIAMVVYNVLSVAIMPPAFTLIAQLFPASLRYSGSNLGQNIGTVLGAGLAPFVGAQLAIISGSVFGPAIWIIAVASIGLTALAILAWSSHRSPSIWDDGISKSIAPLVETD